MKIFPLVILLFIGTVVLAQEDEEYHDFETVEGITIYETLPQEYERGTLEATVLDRLNRGNAGSKEFVELELLDKGGFRKNGNCKYRKTNTSEKFASLARIALKGLSLGLFPIPLKPFDEIEYDRLPKGQCYTFGTVIAGTEYSNASPEVLTVMELEYMLQLEFCYGIMLDDNKIYYTESNIRKFERLIAKLPDYPESIGKLKKRYNNALVKIKQSFDR